MKIIDKNKDYYDYLQGINGVDPEIIYDRRDSAILKNLNYYDRELKINYKISKNKSPCILVNYYLWIGELLYIVVLVGNTNKLFTLEEFKYFLIDNLRDYMKEVNIQDYNLYKIKYNEFLRIYNKYSNKLRDDIEYDDCPILISVCDEDEEDYGWIIKNPILHSFGYNENIIKAQTIWDSVYSWILKQNDKPIVDNRTDIQHLESHGFDKKYSFRKDKQK